MRKISRSERSFSRLNATSRTASRKRKLGLAAAVALAPLSAILSHSARAANTEYDVINGKTDLTAQATYNTGGPSTTGGSTAATAAPTSTSDVTFDSSITYSPTTFFDSSNTALALGSINVLTTTPITIENNVAGDTTAQIQLNGSDSVSGTTGATTTDVIQVASGAALTLGGGLGPLGIYNESSGNPFWLVNGSLTTTSTTTIDVVNSKGLTFVGTGNVTINGNITSTGTPTIFGDSMTGGSLALNGVDSLPFGFTLAGTNGAQLQLGNQNALQTSVLTYTSGAVVFESTVTGNAFTLGGLAGATNLALTNNAGIPAAIALTLGSSIPTAASYTGNLSGAGASVTKIGTNAQTLGGTNSNTGVTTVSAGTLQFAKEVSLYNDANAAAWSASNITVNSGATLAFNVGGTGEFTTSDVTTLLTNLDGAVNNNGLRSGSSIGFDTTNAAGGIFTIANSIANTTGTGGGAVGLIKLGTNTLALTAAQPYTGGTIIAGGTLQLSGGNNLLLNTGTLNFSGNSTLNLSGAISQTLSNITVANNATGTVTGASGTVTVTGASMAIGGTSAAATQTLDLSTLGTFNYNNSAGAFNVGGTYSSTAAGSSSTGTVKLAAVSTITASSVGVGTAGNNGSGNLNQGTLNLGATATIDANTITLGTGLANGAINYGVSTASPTLTIAASDGASRANLTIGTGGGFINSTSSTLDLTTNVTGTSTLNAMISTLTIGDYTRTSTLANTLTTSGALLMEGGTLDATTIILGEDVAGGTAGNTATINGTLTVAGGTVKVQTLSLGTGNDTTAIYNLTGTFNLNGNANLYAGTIDNGAGTGTRAVTRTFNWNAGTIHNYASNNLTIGNNLTTFALLGAGAHTFNIDPSQQGTVAQIISGTGASGLTNAGAGALTLSGLNTYTGPTTLTGGILSTGATGILANGAAASSIGESSDAASNLVLNGGTLQYANTTNTAESTNRLLTLAGNGSLDASGTSTITFAGNGANAISVTASSSPTLTFTGTNTGANTFAPIIGDNGSIITSVAKAGVGTWVLTGADTYSGGTTVNQGTLTSTVAGGFGTGFVTVNPTGTAGTTADAATLNTNNGAIASTAAVTVNTNSATAIGTINFNDATPTIGSLAGTGNVVLNHTGSTALTTGSAGNTTFSGVISNANGTGSLIKAGNTTFTLTGADTYTGGTTVNQGTLAVGNGTTGSLAITSPLTFGGTGAFNYQGQTAGSTQTLGALTLNAGDATVQSTYGGGTSGITFASLAARSVGATGNFVVSGGSNGTTNLIAFTLAPILTNGIISQGAFFGGSTYATYDSITGYVTADNATDDPSDYTPNSGGANAIISNSSSNVVLSGSVTAQGTASINTLNMGAYYTLGLAGGAAFQTNGILVSGNSSSTITGDATSTLSSTTPGGELVIRTDLLADALNISTPIVDNSGTTLTKSGLGLLTLTGSNTYAGQTFVNAGTLTVDASGGSPTATLANTSQINIVNGATLHLLTSTAPTVVNTATTIAISSTGSGQLQLDFNGGVQPIQTFAINGIWQAGGVYGSSTFFADNPSEVASAAPGYVADEGYFTGDGGLSAVPEPGSLSLLALGGLSLMRRRRRNQAVRGAATA